MASIGDFQIQRPVAYTLADPASDLKLSFDEGLIFGGLGGESVETDPCDAYQKARYYFAALSIVSFKLGLESSNSQHLLATKGEGLEKWLSVPFGLGTFVFDGVGLGLALLASTTNVMANQCGNDSDDDDTPSSPPLLVYGRVPVIEPALEQDWLSEAAMLALGFAAVGVYVVGGEARSAALAWLAKKFGASRVALEPVLAH